MTSSSELCFSACHIHWTVGTHGLDPPNFSMWQHWRALPHLPSAARAAWRLTRCVGPAPTAASRHWPAARKHAARVRCATHRLCNCRAAVQPAAPSAWVRSVIKCRSLLSIRLFKSVSREAQVYCLLYHALPFYSLWWLEHTETGWL